MCYAKQGGTVFISGDARPPLECISIWSRGDTDHRCPDYQEQLTANIWSWRGFRL